MLHINGNRLVVSQGSYQRPKRGLRRPVYRPYRPTTTTDRGRSLSIRVVRRSDVKPVVPTGARDRPRFTPAAGAFAPRIAQRAAIGAGGGDRHGGGRVTARCRCAGR